MNEPVYPRSRGEHTEADHHVSVTTGLSPLARGTHCREKDARIAERFIPAHAGNS